MKSAPEVHKVFRYFGQSAPLSEQQFEQVRGEAPAALHVTQTEFLHRPNLNLTKLSKPHEQFEKSIPVVIIQDT